MDEAIGLGLLGSIPMRRRRRYGTPPALTTIITINLLLFKLSNSE